MKQAVFFLFLIVLFSGFSSCRKLEEVDTVPSCIRDLIDEESVNTYPQYARVTQYYYQGGYIYVFKSLHIAVDGSSPVYNQYCQIICYLDGWGIGPCGLGEDFDENGFGATVIWQR